MAACDPWQNTWSAQFKVICDPWLNTWSKWYSKHNDAPRKQGFWSSQNTSRKIQLVMPQSLSRTRDARRESIRSRIHRMTCTYLSVEQPHMHLWSAYLKDKRQYILILTINDGCTLLRKAFRSMALLVGEALFVITDVLVRDGDVMGASLTVLLLSWTSAHYSFWLFTVCRRAIHAAEAWI